MQSNCSSFLASLFLVLASAFAAAQSPPCHVENDGFGYNPNISMGGPNLLIAIRIVAPANLDVQRLEIFTGNKAGTNTLGLWSHDAANNQPGADLGTGSWSAHIGIAWHGTDLPAVVSLTGGQTYWLVWGPQSSAQASVDVPMTVPGQVYRGSFDGGASWNGPWQDANHHWKLRLYCQSITSFCTAKTGLACGTTAIQASGTPSATATSGFVISAAPARTCKSGILVYNTTQAGAGVPFQGGTLCVTAQGLRRAGPTNSMGTPGGANCDGQFAMDMNSFASGSWAVIDCAGNPAGLPPNTPAGFLTSAGQSVFCQYWGRDSVSTGSFVSDGVAYVVGP